jgi:hypothetical protein
MAQSLESRVRDLEHKLELALREIAGVASRPAAPNAPRQGFMLAALTTGLGQGGTATAKIIGFDGENWLYPDLATITVRDFFMNLDEDAYDADTKVLCMWYRNTWVVIYAWCDPSDTLPDEDPAPGETQPPEQFGGENALQFGPDNFTDPGFLPQEALS